MKEFLAAHIVEASIVIAGITAVGVFVGPWFTSWRQRRNTEQDRKLRAHFEELKNEAEDLVSLVSSLKEKNLRIVAVDTSAAELGVGYAEIRAVQISDSFKAHFLRQTEEWRRWEQKAIEHNARCEDFCQRTKIAFESEGIPVVQNDQGKSFTYIYEDVFNPLFNMWKELAQGRHPRPDFQNIDTASVEGSYFLYPSGWEASVVAFAKTEDDLEKCKLALARIAGDGENQREAAEIFSSASELMKEAREFADQFASKLNDMDTFWPPKKPNEFKELKKTCPRCKELF